MDRTERYRLFDHYANLRLNGEATDALNNPQKEREQFYFLDSTGNRRKVRTLDHELTDRIQKAFPHPVCVIEEEVNSVFVYKHHVLIKQSDIVYYLVFQTFLKTPWKVKYLYGTLSVFGHVQSFSLGEEELEKIATRCMQVFKGHKKFRLFEATGILEFKK